MTEILYSPKIKPEHLARRAIVYLRQSSEKQVRQNKESQRLQYDVAERMRALGWKQVEIVNSDHGVFRTAQVLRLDYNKLKQRTRVNATTLSSSPTAGSRRVRRSS